MPERVQDDLIRQFIAGATLRSAADLVGVNQYIATLYSHELHELNALKQAEKKPWLSGRFDVNES